MIFRDHTKIPTKTKQIKTSDNKPQNKQTKKKNCKQAVVQKLFKIIYALVSLVTVFDL